MMVALLHVFEFRLNGFSLWNRSNSFVGFATFPDLQDNPLTVIMERERWNIYEI